MSLAAAATLILAAAPFADLAAIDRQVAAFTAAPTGAEGGAMMPVDRRLRLRPCVAPLQLSWRTTRHESVIVECPDAGGWRIFVPVRAVAAASAALAVHRGDGVTIAVAGPGFAVSQPGEALDGGAPGAWIRVRTTGARPQTMRGRIASPGRVEVPIE